MKIEDIEPVEIYLNDELIGLANQIITNDTGSYYAEDGEYLQDNGDYIPVGGFGVDKYQAGKYF